MILALGIYLSGCGGGGSSPAAGNPPPSNQAPTANAGADQSIVEGTTGNLSATGADGDGTIVSYSWQQESGTAVTITNANMANASFVAPMVAASEILLFRVTVTDDDGATGSDTVTVTVNGIAPPPPPPPTPNASPGGIWTGIDSDGDLITAFVTETGRFHVIDEFLNQGSGILSVSNGNDVTANFQLVTEFGFTFPDGTTLADCTLSGTVTERQTMSVTVSCTTTAGLQDQITVTLNYDAIYERDSSLATIAGVYDDGSGIVTDIASDGMIFEQDPVSGCVTNGQVAVIDSAFNAYDVQFGFSNCTGPFAILNGSSFVGIGTLDNTVTPEVLNVAATGDIAGTLVSFVSVSERL